MNVQGLAPSTAAQQPAQLQQLTNHRRHHGSAASAISDVDAQGSSITAGSALGSAPGSLLNIRA